MKLREWRKKKGWPLWKVVEELKEFKGVKRSVAAISCWETRGVKNYANQMLLKGLSNNKITDFGASDD